VDLSELIDAVRRHIRIVIAAVALAGLVAGLYVFTRHEARPPDKYQAVADVQIPAPAPTNRNAPQPEAVASANVPEKLLRGQVQMALSGDVRKPALSDSGIPSNDASVIFGAQLNNTQDTITLTVTSTDAKATNKLIENFVNAFANARTAVSAQDIQASRQGSQQELNALQTRQSALESQLRPRIDPLPPIVTDPSLATDTGSSGRTRAQQQQQQQQQAVPIIPPGADSNTALMLFERNALANRITAVQLAIADAAVNSNVPSSYTEVLDQSGATVIPGKTSSPVVPAGVILLGGLALGLAAAILVDRRDHTIRSVKVASSTLAAPLLSTVPPPGHGQPEYAVFEHPDSARSAAFRKLAATSLATDRLPTAIMVSTPEGDAYDYVAANFAAALADLGAQVALVATSPRQSWYLDDFTVPLVDGGNDLPQLLDSAHSGEFNGQATSLLAWSDLTPNLVVVPPAPESPHTVPLDGLPPFLESLERSGIDVTVIAGPPLLQDANATIFAWSTRSVLWAVQAGVVHRRAASEAAARLELASVEPFGLVMVGAAED
jgi:capsular polysaccharide biosynthesis protein